MKVLVPVKRVIDYNVKPRVKADATGAYDHYIEMLNESEAGDQIDPDRAGLARELARMNLPLKYRSTNPPQPWPRP